MVQLCQMSPNEYEYEYLYLTYLNFYMNWSNCLAEYEHELNIQ